MPGDENTSREAIRHAARLFNERSYFEAHDALEEEWAETRGPRRVALGALVKVAAGMYHLQTSNFAGAESLLSSGLASLRSEVGERAGIEVGDGLRLAMRPLADPLDAVLGKLAALRAGKPPRWALGDLPRFRFDGSGNKSTGPAFQEGGGPARRLGT